MKKKLLKLFSPKVFLAAVAVSMVFPASVFAQWSTGTYAGYGLPVNSLYGIISGIMRWLLSIFGFFAIVGFVISGIMYLTAAGDEEQQKKAKRQMYWSIIGVIVGLVGLVIIFAVDNLLRANYNF